MNELEARLKIHLAFLDQLSRPPISDHAVEFLSEAKLVRHACTPRCQFVERKELPGCFECTESGHLHECDVACRYLVNTESSSICPITGFHVEWHVDESTKDEYEESITEPSALKDRVKSLSHKDYAARNLEVEAKRQQSALLRHVKQQLFVRRPASYDAAANASVSVSDANRNELYESLVEEVAETTSPEIERKLREARTYASTRKAEDEKLSKSIADVALRIQRETRKRRTSEATASAAMAALAPSATAPSAPLGAAAFEPTASNRLKRKATSDLRPHADNEKERESDEILASAKRVVEQKQGMATEASQRSSQRRRRQKEDPVLTRLTQARHLYVQFFPGPKKSHAAERAGKSNGESGVAPDELESVAKSCVELWQLVSASPEMVERPVSYDNVCIFMFFRFLKNPPDFALQRESWKPVFQRQHVARVVFHSTEIGSISSITGQKQSVYTHAFGRLERALRERTKALAAGK